MNWFALDRSPTVPLMVTGLATYSFACTNCGFVRLHLRAVVDEEVSGQANFE
jgi:hypothetical protein